MSTPRTALALRALAFACPIAIAWWVSGLQAPQLDEHVHVAQVELLFERGLAIHERLTLLPGLHLVVAGVHALGPSALHAGRAVVVGFAMVMLLAGLGLARRIVPERAELRVLALAVFPLAAPLCAVFYTDVPGLACLLLAMLAIEAGAPGRASVAFAAMLALRHSLVAFVPFGFVASLRPEDDWRGWLRRAWPILVPALALGALLAGLGAATLGDARHHPGGLFAPNLPFAAVLALALFSPSHVRAAPRVVALVRRAPVACLVTVSLAGAIALLADATHPFNDPSLDRLLYVAWIDALFRSGPGRALMLLASAYVPLSFATWRWRLPRFAWLAPFAVLRLSMSWLVEPRYALPFLALVLLAREEEPRWLEALYVVAYAAGSLYLLHGMTVELWFPL